MSDSLKQRLRGRALQQYNDMIDWLGDSFDEKTWHVVVISDTSGNIEELAGAGKTFNDAKRALRQAWKTLRADYDEKEFSVDLLVGGRLRSYVI